MNEKIIFEKPSTISSGEDIVSYFLKNEITVHPFFKLENSFNIGYIKLILENGRDLDITGFLARTISMTQDLNIRCALVTQLYDELGGGDIHKLHIHHIVNLLNAIEPLFKFKNLNDKTNLENAYQSLSKEYKNLFFSDNFNTCIGVAIANEIIVQPIFEYIKEVVFKYKDLLKEDEITWVTAHNELEEDHIGDTLSLSKIISQDKNDLLQVFDAGFQLLNAFWNFFNVLQTVELE